MAARTMTFVFTDIEGSTRRWEADEAATLAAMLAHDRLLRDEIEASGGEVFKHTGDGCSAVFDDPVPAVEAAIGAQRRLAAGEAGDLQVRMAVYTGPGEPRAGDWFGPALNRCAHVLGAIHGGQVVVGATTAVLVRDHVELMDLGEHTLHDIAEAEQLWQVTADGLHREFPELSTAIARSNLPIARTSFVGREAAVDHLLRRISTARLTTLTGIGGSGKTRLATVVAEAASHRYADGVWFVDLAPVADATLVASTFASALAIPGAGEPGRDVQLYVAGKQLLLVVDNCEHVLDATSRLIDEILARAAGVAVLATSREALGLDGEQIWRVASLDPEIGSLELFEDRARAVRAEFVVDDSNRATVLGICSQLDGIPLAIELAAAQIAVFTASQIEGMLDERFTLLSGGRRRGRQATLATTMDWSYKLLSETECAGLRHASVLPGSFSLSAFAAVSDSSGGDAVSIVRALVDKSLFEAGADGRYRMLETVRLYAEDRLAEAGDAATTRDRLIDWIRSRLLPLNEADRAEFVIEELEAIRARERIDRAQPREQREPLISSRSSGRRWSSTCCSTTSSS